MAAAGRPAATPPPPAGPPTINPDTFLAALATRWHEEGLAGPSEQALLAPEGMEVGSPAHLRFLTLPRATAPLNREVAHWQRAAAAWHDPTTRWLYDPATVARAPWQQVRDALATHQLASRRQEVRGWYDIARALQMRARGDVATLLRDAGGTTSALLRYLQQNKSTFPLLSGPRTARLWLDQLRRIGCAPLTEDSPLLLPPGAAALRALHRAGLSTPTDPVPAAHALALSIWAALPAAQRDPLTAALVPGNEKATGCD